MSTIILHSLLPVLHFNQTYFSSFRKILPTGYLNPTFKSCFTQYSLWKPDPQNKKKKKKSQLWEANQHPVTYNVRNFGWVT